MIERDKSKNSYIKARFMDIYRLPARTDNYIFLLHSPSDQTAAVVDPADAAPVLEQLGALGADLVAIFNTHHHNDHVGGNRQLLARFPQAQVYGGAADRGRIPGQQHFLEQGDRVSFANRSAEVFFVPGHTRGHIAYYFAPVETPAPGELFCGDTLFAGGCGRLFEGTPEQMVDSLAKLRELPDNTRIWCAHEYTLSNLRFAVSVDADNAALVERLSQTIAQRQQNQPTVPSLLGEEKATNPFLRWDAPALRTAAQGIQSDSVQDDSERSAVAVFTRIRAMKDRF
jgi:hydroxyacylglutathione hydrolase